MKIHSASQKCRQRGLSLLEALVYMAVFFVLLACATAAFFQSWADTTALHRNATEIQQALHVGEQWRADVRGATGILTVGEAAGFEELRIPTPKGQVVYTFSQNQVRRQAAGDATGQLWLDHVKWSRVESDPRTNVTAYRWELELLSSLKTAKFHPLFTFEAAAGRAPVQ